MCPSCSTASSAVGLPGVEVGWLLVDGVLEVVVGCGGVEALSPLPVFRSYKAPGGFIRRPLVSRTSLYPLGRTCGGLATID